MMNSPESLITPGARRKTAILKRIEIDNLGSKEKDRARKIEIYAKTVVAMVKVYTEGSMSREFIHGDPIDDAIKATVESGSDQTAVRKHLIASGELADLQTILNKKYTATVKEELQILKDVVPPPRTLEDIPKFLELLKQLADEAGTPAELLTEILAEINTEMTAEFAKCDLDWSLLAERLSEDDIAHLRKVLTDRNILAMIKEVDDLAPALPQDPNLIKAWQFLLERMVRENFNKFVNFIAGGPTKTVALIQSEISRKKRPTQDMPKAEKTLYDQELADLKTKLREAVADTRSQKIPPFYHDQNYSPEQNTAFIIDFLKRHLTPDRVKVVEKEFTHHLQSALEHRDQERQQKKRR